MGYLSFSLRQSLGISLAVLIAIALSYSYIIYSISSWFEDFEDQVPDFDLSQGIAEIVSYYESGYQYGKLSTSDSLGTRWDWKAGKNVTAGKYIVSFDAYMYAGNYYYYYLRFFIGWNEDIRLLSSRWNDYYNVRHYSFEVWVPENTTLTWGLYKADSSSATLPYHWIDDLNITYVGPLDLGVKVNASDHVSVIEDPFGYATFNDGELRYPRGSVDLASASTLLKFSFDGEGTLVIMADRNNYYYLTLPNGTNVLFNGSVSGAVYVGNLSGNYTIYGQAYKNPQIIVQVYSTLSSGGESVTNTTTTTTTTTTVAPPNPDTWTPIYQLPSASELIRLGPNEYLIRLRMENYTQYVITVLDASGNPVLFNYSITGWPPLTCGYNYTNCFGSYSVSNVFKLIAWFTPITINNTVYEGIHLSNWKANTLPANVDLVLSPYRHLPWSYDIVIYVPEDTPKPVQIIVDTGPDPAHMTFWDYLQAGWKPIHDFLMGTPLGTAIKALDTLGGFLGTAIDMMLKIGGVVYVILSNTVKFMVGASPLLIVIFALLLIADPIGAIEFAKFLWDLLRSFIELIANIIRTLKPV